MYDIERIKINKKFEVLFNDKSRIEVIYGGAGSGKSYAAAQKIVLSCLSSKKYKWLVVRKVAKTIRFSVFALIKKIISDWGVYSLFKVNKSEFNIICDNGNEIIFLGLDDVEKLKSIDGITSVWGEEASEITETDVRQLNLRLRGKTEVHKQIILTFNPISKLHWIKKFYFDHKRDNCFIHKSTYKDNRFLDEEYKIELENLKDEDYIYYQIYCLAEWGSIGNVVFSNYVIENFKYNNGDFDEVIQGMDFGYNHPFAFEQIGFKDGELYFNDEIHVRNMSNPELIEHSNDYFASKNILDEVKKRITIADSAEPDRIKEWRKAGWNVIAAKKGKDSVRYGIDYLRGKRLHIKPSCIGISRELEIFKNKEDKDGNLLEEFVNLNDDGIAASRYATEHLWDKRSRDVLIKRRIF